MPAGLDSVYFGNSGAEVVDGAVKLARRATGRSHVIAFRGAFHGRTYGAAEPDHVATSTTGSATSPLLPGHPHRAVPASYRDFGGDERGGLGGLPRPTSSASSPRRCRPRARPPSSSSPCRARAATSRPRPAFLQGLRELADRHGILLILDEVQSGYGRTGRMWAFEHAGIVPDVVLAGQGHRQRPAACGHRVAARRCRTAGALGAHGSTYGGNPVACAAGIAVLEVIREEGLVANAAARGAELTRGLLALAAEDPRIGDVRGPGLMIGVEFVKDRETREPDGDLGNALSAACADRGLLLLTCGPDHNVIRWIPPLDVDRPRSRRRWASSRRCAARTLAVHVAGVARARLRPRAAGISRASNLAAGVLEPADALDLDGHDVAVPHDAPWARGTSPRLPACRWR